MNFKLILDCASELAETPIWDSRKNKLYWTDLFKGEVHQYDPALREDWFWETNQLVGSAVPCTDERYLLVALEEGMSLLNTDTGERSLICQPEIARPENRYNDTRVDALGRIYTSSVSKLYGSKEYKPDMKGAFYMVDTDDFVHVVVPEINQYNAIVWNSDNSVMYVIDTYNESLLAFDYDLDRGPKGSWRVAVDFKEIGMPDGMSIDSEDNLYVCHWTGKITVWDKTLNLKRTVDFPVEQVCCGGFGGTDMEDFYVASARYGYTPEDCKNNPSAGGIFVARNEIAGIKDHYYIVK